VPATASEEDLRLMRLIDQQFLRTPFFGSRRMRVYLERAGETVNRKRVQRLMAVMGLEALFPRPRTTTAASGARVYPYLLRDRVLTHADEVWSSDIMYVPMWRGFMYLTAVIDWYSRYVLSWRLSNTLDGRFCLEALDEALAVGRPEIFNTDQGAIPSNPAGTSLQWEPRAATSFLGSLCGTLPALFARDNRLGS